MIDKMPHTHRQYGPNQGYLTDNINPGSPFRELLEVHEEDAIWSIHIPGISPDTLDLYTVGNEVKLIIKNGYRGSDYKTSFILAEGEYVDYAQHELGILSVTINRPDKIISIEIDIN